MTGRLIHDLIDTQPGHLIRLAHQRSWSVFMDAAKIFNITPPQFAALVAIAEHPGVDATRLSALIAFDRATTGNVLDRLEKKGLLTRKQHASDRRTKVTFLTRNGRQTLKTLARAMPRIAERTLQGLNATERRQLLRLLARLVGGKSR